MADDHVIPLEGVSYLGAPIPVPTYGSKGLFATISKINIAAPPAAVLEALLDYKSYSKWNNALLPGRILSEGESTALSKAGHLSLGTELVITVNMSGGSLEPGAKGSRDSTIQITRVEELADGKKGFRVAWRPLLGVPSWLLHIERVHVMFECAGGTQYEDFETWGGILARLMRAMYGQIFVDGFAEWNRNLKKFVEESNKMA